MTTSGLLICVRLKSTRLPLKALKLIEGESLIGHLLNRLRLVKQVNQIILCTSVVAQDDPLVEFAQENKIACFRGHPEDVLIRIKECTTLYNFDKIGVVTGDNPVIDASILETLLELHDREKNDFSFCSGYPIGVTGWILSRKALELACAIKNTTDTEWWTKYFTETGIFRVGELKAPEEYYFPEIRLTVDTPQDLSLMKAIFGTLKDVSQPFTLRNILELLRHSPELLMLNQSIQQKTPHPISLKPNWMHLAQSNKCPI